MTVIRKRTGDKGGCCSPYSELQLEIERVDQTAIDAKTTANNAEATINANMDKVNEAIAIVPQVQTNTEVIAAHDAELMDHDARIHTNTIVNDQQNTDIANLKTKANDNTSAIEALENEIGQNKIDIQEQGKDIAALKTKTNDNATAIEALENEVGPETVAGTIQYRLKDIDTKLPTAIKEVEMIADASTVTHKATHISGTAESDALPVVSREQAGIMSASVYAAMEDVIANNTSRISVLEQSALTYDISGLVSADPTNAEISAAFHQKYPNIPIQPGIRVADYDHAHFWQYGNNMWILLTQINIQTATNESLGIVKGSTVDGKIFVETDGSMSLKGYDALVSKDATHDSKISTLETGLGDANARIDAANANVAKNAADIVTANGNISANANDITSLKGRMTTAEGQIATHETKINQNTQSINGLSNDISGLNDRMSTAEGQITTHETKINQHTQSINGLSTDVNGLKTDVNKLKTDVNGLSTDVNGLKTDVNNLESDKQGKWSITNRSLTEFIVVNHTSKSVEITRDLYIEFLRRSSNQINYSSIIIPKIKYTDLINNDIINFYNNYSNNEYYDKISIVYKDSGYSLELHVNNKGSSFPTPADIDRYQLTNEIISRNNVDSLYYFRIKIQN